MHLNILSLVLAGFFLPVLSAGAAMTQENSLIFHRAIYEVRLDKVGSKSSITDLSGRIVYKFDSDFCGGFATQFRFVTRFDMENLPPQINDQRERELIAKASARRGVVRMKIQTNGKTQR